MDVTKVVGEYGGRPIEIETGRLALQAGGSCTVKYGNTVVLATVCMSQDPLEGADFLPLTVDFEEKFYASGKIKGSRFIKREGRPSENAILTSRLIDRSIRPLFPKGLTHNIQLVTTVLASDNDADPAITAMIAASTALLLSGLPFEGPISGARVGFEDNKLILNPVVVNGTPTMLDLFVTASKDSVVMLEAGANEVNEDIMVQAIEFAIKQNQIMIDLQNELLKKVTVKPFEYKPYIPGDEVTRLGDETFRVVKLSDKITEYITDVMLDDVILHKTKEDYEAAHKALMKSVLDKYEEYADFPQASVQAVLDTMLKKRVRYHILENDRRPDGRALDEIRTLSMEVGLLPTTHGSAMFMRGETQALSIVTLAAKNMGQLLDEMDGEYTKYYMHHYNFPAYSVGEARPMRSTGRREIGHGNLAERALEQMIPSIEEFPYAIRIVSEIMGSSGSTSMASVCGSTLSLMDAGVPIKKPVSGIAMGLMTDKEKDVYKILTDIKDIEDYSGDMDFKVAGTRDGITAIQMDIKVKGLSMAIIKEGLEKAKVARLFILDSMAKVLSEPRSELSPNAPRVVTIKIHPDQIREVIGAGGKVIQDIIAKTGVEIDIDDDGSVNIFSHEAEGTEKAVQMVKDITYKFQVGDIFEGKVTRIIKDMSGKDIGAVVERSGGKDGMVHISEVENHHIAKIEDVIKVGDMVKVKVIAVDAERGRVSLSRKALLDGR